MNLEKIKNRFLRLDIYSKLIALGSFVTVISVVMPWYEDLDAFKTGDMFLGLTGPLYLAGYVILLSSLFSLSLIGLNILEKKAPRLPMQANHIHIAAAILNIFLLVLVHSVYFHDKFGVNIALKESRFGMSIAFLGSLTLLASSIIAERKKVGTLEFDHGKLEPLITLNRHSRDQRDLTPQLSDMPKAEQVEHKSPLTNANHQIRTDIRETVQKDMTTENKAGGQPWRMDL